MIIKTKGYNILDITIPETITPGTQATIGTAKDYERIRKVAGKSGLFIVHCKITGNDGVGGTCCVNLYDDGIDFGCPNNVGGYPTLITGTISMSGSNCVLDLNVKTFTE